MRITLIIIFFGLAPRFSTAQNNISDSAAKTQWIQKSNHYTKMLIDIVNKFYPEAASEQGEEAFDTMVMQPTLANKAMERAQNEQILLVLGDAKNTESNIALKQDLDILINHTKLTFREDDFQKNKKVSFFNPTADVLEGMQAILDDQSPVRRRPSALVRLKKYAGLVPDSKSLASIYKERTLLQMAKPDMIYPSRKSIEVGLQHDASMIDGISALFTKYNVDGWQNDFAILKNQLQAYDQWVTENLLPRGRADYKLPPEEYQLALEDYGIDIPPSTLASEARTLFQHIQEQMAPIAAKIATNLHLDSSDYRYVIRYLKKNQITGDSIMIVYKNHLADIENIIRKNHLITLPDRPAIIRLATQAETAQIPAPHMVPPPFLNNTGQRGVFVLPLNMPPAPGQKEDRYDDFTFDAASWTLIAHEARPGHELQFDKMVELGVSNARVLYAFNSTNVEGWGLYSEYMILPYMPLEGQLISLNGRLLRAARAFLDPGLQAGTVTPEQAFNLLQKDVVLSHASATQEVERYTVRAPGQANSYFYGFTKMVQLRMETEKLMGAKFNAMTFHDFILSQGLLPPALIREAVLNNYVKQNMQ